MTVQELIDELQEYPKDLEVEVELETFDGIFSSKVKFSDIEEYNEKKKVVIYGIPEKEQY